MDKNLAAKVQELVAENKLDEALQMLISSLRESSDRQLNSLILLKGKLSLLKEQEQGGLLDFEEAAQERAKIAYSLLGFINSKPDETDLASPAMPASPKKPAASILKYALIGAGILTLLVVVIFFLFVNIKSDANSPGPFQEENNSSRASDASSSHHFGSYHFTKNLPLGQPFTIGNVSYTIQSATLEKYADPVPPNPGLAKLTFQSVLIGKTTGTGGVSWREQKVRVWVDGEPYAPKSQGINGGWIELDSRAQDELVFAFPDNGKKYELEFTFEDQVHRFPFAFSRK
jgi:hypothetical protein